MSQALERLLPAVVRHLSGNFFRNEVPKNKNYGNPEKSKSPSDNLPDVSADDSAHRWRRCVELWRRLVGSDRLFLALLYHSGSLWAEERHLLADEQNTESVPHRRSWADAVMWFLQLHDEDIATKHERNNDDSGYVHSHPSAASSDRVGGVHIHSLDEPATQRAAMGLLGEWFVIVDGCGPRFSRAYYFSCALKMSALVGNTVMIEDTPHLHDIIAREPRFATLFTAFHSILCCLLVEEAQRQPLYLPPPFFLLPFNAIGRGSRVGVWLPRGSDGEFHSCEVCSAGVLLRVDGDFVLDVRLVDEAYTEHSALGDVLPRLHGDEEKRRSRARGTALDRAAVPRCWSAMLAATNGALRIDWLRARAVVAAAAAPSLMPATSGAKFTKNATGNAASKDTTAATGNNNNNNSSSNNNNSSNGVSTRRRATAAAAAGGSGGSANGMAPLSRNSRRTISRDAIATIAFYLATTARRLMGCRGTFVDPDGSTSATPSTAHTPKASSSLSHHSPATGTGATMTAKTKTTAPTAVASFSTVSEELEVLVECAVHLFLAALLLCHALPNELAPQVDAWAVEVTSNTADLVLATPQPVVRIMCALGFALCLAPRPPQSLLVTVGVLVTLARRQKRPKQQPQRDGSGWWDVFKACVLRDAAIAGQLHSATWGLVERVERDLRGTLHVRMHKTPQQQQQQKPQPQPQPQGKEPQQQQQQQPQQSAEAEAKQRGGREEDEQKEKEAARAESTSANGAAVVAAVGPPPIPAGIRVARTVSVVDTEDIGMTLWWTLEQQAANEMGST